jgi:hypothetical protein
LNNAPSGGVGYEIMVLMCLRLILFFISVRMIRRGTYSFKP